MACVVREFKGRSIFENVEEYCVIDLETTGLSPIRNEIIEFCGIKVSRGRIVDEMNTLVRPEKHISKTITRITGIDDSLVANAPSIEDVIGPIAEYIGDSVILGHNVNFDINFLYDRYLAHLGRPMDNDFVDLLRISKKVLPELPNHKLGTVSDLLNTRYFPSHRARNDCLATYEAYEAVRKSVGPNDRMVGKRLIPCSRGKPFCIFPLPPPRGCPS